MTNSRPNITMPTFIKSSLFARSVDMDRCTEDDLENNTGKWFSQTQKVCETRKHVQIVDVSVNQGKVIKLLSLPLIIDMMGFCRANTPKYTFYPYW